MFDFRKKLFIGILSGAMIFTGGTSSAAPEVPELPEYDEARQEKSVEAHGAWLKYFSDKYGVDSAQIEKALSDGVHIGDIRYAAVLSKLSGKNFSDVLAMKVDWGQVADKLGVKHEQIADFFQQEREEYFAKRVGIDVKTLQALLKDDYAPHDIDIAGKIAKASNKNIKNVLEKRRINNTWEDVAKSFGVDMKKIMPPPPHGHHHKGQS